MEKLNQQLEKYLGHIDSERRLSENTIKAYRSDIKLFLSFLENHDSEYANIDEDIVREYAIWLGSTKHKSKPDIKASGKLSPSTLERRLVGLKRFLRYLFESGELESPLDDQIDLPKKPKHLPEYLSPKAVSEILYTQTGNDLTGLRNIAILETLYGSGCRVSELIGMDVDDLYMATGAVRVTGKGSKERVVIIGEYAIGAVKNYLNARAKAIGEPVGALFVGKTGKRLSVRTVQRLVKKASELAGIPGGITPHGIRHSYATHLLAGGADLRSIQELLGHASLSTVQKYTHLNTKELHETHSKSHPLGESSD